MSEPRLKKQRLENKSNDDDNDADIPLAFICPITQTVMQDPVSTMDGHVYEHYAIEQWFVTGNTRSPVTNNPLGTYLSSSHAVRFSLNCSRQPRKH